MGYKKVCIDCKKAFSIYQNQQKNINLTCPNCGNETTLFNHKFKPPKQNDLAAWKVIGYLKNNGFRYQRIYKYENGVATHVDYPATLQEAKDFVENFKSQSYFFKRS